MEDIIFTTKELADYLHVSIQTINKMRKEKVIPCFRPLGRGYLFKKSSIDIWIHNEEMKTLQNENEIEVRSIGEK